MFGLGVNGRLGDEPCRRLNDGRIRLRLELGLGLGLGLVGSGLGLGSVAQTSVTQMVCRPNVWRLLGKLHNVHTGTIFFPVLLASSIFMLVHFFPFYQNSLTPFPVRMS